MGVVPFYREMAECLSDHSPYKYVAFQKPSQVGATEFGVNFILYYLDQHPCGILFLEPTDTVSKRMVKQRIDPAILECPRLLEKVHIAKRTNGSFSVTEKSVPGGFLVCGGASSASQLRSMTYRILAADEVDGWESDLAGEGDPLLLAERGTRTYTHDKKIFICSTPTLESTSRIRHHFILGDQRYYHIPCPLCGTYQKLYWKNEEGRYGLTWKKGDFKTAQYVCEHCDRPFAEKHKIEFLEAGTWIKENPDADPLRASFFLNALYSPFGWYSWADMAEKFETSKDNVEMLKVFVNQDLGECWSEAGVVPDWSQLYRQREDYDIGTVPSGGLVLTAGVDVQQDRIEVEVVAWGPDMESWSVDFQVIAGSTSTERPWNDLRRVLDKSYPSEDGFDIPISIMAVDSGFDTQRVYQWCQGQSRVIAVKGFQKQDSVVGIPTLQDVSRGGKKIARGIKLWKVGTDTAKQEIYNFLLQDPKSPKQYGRSHFPGYDEDHFKSLTAEQRQAKRNKQGHLQHDWVVLYNRNEKLDCRVYALAAAQQYGLRRWVDKDWHTRRMELIDSVKTLREQPDTAAHQVQRLPGNFLSGFSMSL